MKKYSPNWEIMPEGLKEKIKSEEKKYRDSCQNREMPPKHKYVYILGRSKKETKELKKLFDKFNPDVVGLEYPSERGK